MIDKFKNKAKLWKNIYKKTDTQPGYKGKGNYDCPHCNKNIEFDLAGWLKTDDEGKQAIGLTIQEPWKKEQ